MSWLSELFGGSSAPAQVVPPSAEQVANYYRQVKVNNPGYYEQIKENDPEWISGQQAAASAPTPAPTPHQHQRLHLVGRQKHCEN